MAKLAFSAKEAAFKVLSPPGLASPGFLDVAIVWREEREFGLRAESLARLVLPARAEGDTEGEVAGYGAHRRELNDFTIERLTG